MLDIQPEPDHEWVEVQVGNKYVPIGRLDKSSFITDIKAARNVLASLIEAGYFVIEDEVKFEFIYYFDSVENWLSYIGEHRRRSVLDPDIVARSRGLMSQGGSGLRMRESSRAARLRRV